MGNKSTKINDWSTPEKEARKRGYDQGSRGIKCNPDKFSYKGHLKDAFVQGHGLGKSDHERDMIELRQFRRKT